MSTCHCFQGSPADAGYTPRGSYSEIGGLGVYHTKPRLDEAGGISHGNILFLPDGFGLAAHNLRLADMYADNGFATTVVDYFEGDALPDVFMKYTPETDLDSYTTLSDQEKSIIRKIDMPAWQRRHQQDHLSKLLDSFFPEFCQSLRSEADSTRTEPGKLHILGHCFGGKHAFRLAKLGEESGVTSAVIFHPAFLDQSDTQNLQKPVFVGCAETDVFTPNLINTMLSQLPKSGARYKFLVYGGTRHGFASRPDPEDSRGMLMFQQAFDDGLAWMKSL